jgi:uncharacterized membrane protein YcfT
MGARTGSSDPRRIDWVDYAKGFCIFMVVTMHSTLGVEAAAGVTSWLHVVSDFSKPFRMPDFFLISGLFLARSIEQDWRTYLDRKLVHFAYLYALWLTIQFAFKGPVMAAEHGVWGAIGMYLYSYVEPFSTLWFIYLLPIFLVVTKLTRRLPPLVIFLAGVALEIAHIETGHVIIDEFAARFVYFFTGYWLAKYAFALAREAAAYPLLAGAALVTWGYLNATLAFSGLANLPLVSLMLGFLGAGAVVTLSALLAQVRFFDVLRRIGELSIVVYLAFFLPMAATRTVLLNTGLVPDLGTVALIVTLMAIAVPILLHALVRNTRFRFLFERPAAFRIAPSRRPAILPAE